MPSWLSDAASDCKSKGCGFVIFEFNFERFERLYAFSRPVSITYACDSACLFGTDSIENETHNRRAYS